MSYVFPDMELFAREIALYSFVVLIAPHVPRAVLRSEHQSDRLPRQLRRTARPGSLSRIQLDAAPVLQRLRWPVMRQTHMGRARIRRRITLHLLRIIFTGAFRKPRDINYFIGLTLLILAILEGFAGYRCPTTCSPGWASRSPGASRCHCHWSVARSRSRSGAAASLARRHSSRGCTSRTYSSSPRCSPACSPYIWRSS